MSYYSSSDMEYDNGYYSEDNYNNNYNNGYNDDSDNGYDDSDNGYNDSDGDSRNGYEYEGYECPVPQEQFDDSIDDYFKDLLEDPDRKLKGHTRIKQVRKHMDRVYTRNSILFCLDFEAWEKDPNRITEVGVSVYDPRFQEQALCPNIKTMHLIVAENKRLRNGQYVPDNQDNFMGKKSWTFEMDHVRWILQELIDRYFDPDYPYYCSLVGHDLRGDLEWLEKIGVDIPRNVRQLDTQTLFSYTHGRDGASLKNCLEAVNQPFAYLHNAGNDAYYTTLLALKLCDPHVRDLTDFDCYKDDEPTSISAEDLVDKLMM